MKKTYQQPALTLNEIELIPLLNGSPTNTPGLSMEKVTENEAILSRRHPTKDWDDDDW